jgi:hypothetical protein
MLYERVKITRDPHTVYNRSVLPWEIAILEFTFEEGNVQRTGDFERTDAPYPEPHVEFQRLVQAYGSDPQNGTPYAASVFGQASAGVNALRRAIAEVKAEDAATKPKVASRQRARKAPTAKTLNDPLMA